jgi:hypothetical protein
LANDEGYPVRLFRNRRMGQRFLAVTEPNGDVIYAELDENDRPINAGNRFPRDEYNNMLNDLEMEADYNTVGFTFIGEEFVPRQRPERL